MLRLAANPHIAEELLQEQRDVLGVNNGTDLPPLTYEGVQKLQLNAKVVKETLRIHAPIHSIMRKVKSPMHLAGTPYTIPTSHILMAAPGVTSKQAEYFPNPDAWDPHRWDDKDKPQSSAPTAGTTASKGEGEGGGGGGGGEELIDYGYGLVTKGASSPYLPFGAGRHRCIGEQFAYLQLGTIIATLVRHLKFANVDGGSQVVGTDYTSLFSQPLRPAVVGWEKRVGKETAGVGEEGEKRRRKSE